METPDQEPENVDARIEDLFERLGECLERALSRSASRLAGEVKRLAKAEQRIVPYMRSTFHLMDLARDLLEPETCRAQAVELIALLESEEHARLIQPDFPQDEYDSQVAWMSTCAYDNLAEGTAMAQGFNSEGMHGCISEGLQVCQRTGKMECVNCFREYAADVYLAADDLPLALHQMRLISSPNNTHTQRGDRRWLGIHDEAWVLLLTGQIEAAEEAAQRSLELTGSPGMNLPLYAKLRATPTLETVLLLAGKELVRPTGQPEGVKVIGQPPEGEYPVSDLLDAQAVSLAAACRGDHAAAIAILTRWDRLLQERNCLHDWFEVRLRLTAVQLLAGNRRQADALAAQLLTKAQKARDWLTLRRLERLMDPAVKPIPLPLLLPLTAGPYAGSTLRSILPSVAVPAASLEAEEATSQSTPKPPTPLQAVLSALYQRAEEAEENEDEEGRVQLVDEVLGIPAESVTHPTDAAVLLSLAGRLADVANRGRELWEWAEPVAARFPQNAEVLNLFAWLGFCLGSNAEEANPDQGLEEELAPDIVDKLFRQSLDLDPHAEVNFGRAGLFYLAVENLGEAERCLARGFRLNRQSSILALRLAAVYQQTDRPRDALMVLDTCLREGGDDPDLAWRAAMVAVDLEQWDSLVTYLERYEQQCPDEQTTVYYRAFGLLGLERAADALALLDEKAPPPASEHLEVLRACVQAECGQTEAFRAFVQESLLNVRLREWYDVPRPEMVRLFARVWTAMDCLSQDDPLREQLIDLLLETGLAPEEVFEEVRQRGEESDVHFYRCVVHQPLDESWPTSRGCLPNEEDWIGYGIAWGVLAADEESARAMVLEWQSRCYPLAAEIVDVEPDPADYADKPGIVWQGIRSGTEAEEEQDED